MAAARVGAKIVLVDLGPSSGILNETFVMSCDFIIPPTCPDYYSVASVDGLLTTVFPRWLKNFDVRGKACIQLLQQYRDPNYAAYGLNPYPPRILPFPVLMYNIMGGKKKKFFEGKDEAEDGTKYANLKHIKYQPSRWILTLEQLVHGNTIPEEVKVFFFFLAVCVVL
jgi:hypothetical protein